MGEIGYYFSIFLRRLPFFLPVVTVITAVAVIVAFSLPPAYVSTATMVVESPEIPSNLAASTVRAPALERLQIIQQRLLVRANMLGIARDLDALPELGEMSPDAIVNAMRARTSIDISSGRNAATLMNVSFEAPDPQKAAGVVNRYLTLIQQEDAEYRRGRSGTTLDFFEQQVAQLGEELDTQSSRILEFKQKNTGTLPESLDFRMSQQSNLQDQLTKIDRDLTGLKDQRERMVQVFNATGQTGGAASSPAQKRLQGLRNQLDEALAIYSEQAPKVQVLKARIDRAEERLADQDAAQADEAASDAAVTGEDAQPTMLDIQLSEIDSRMGILKERRGTVQERLAGLTDSIKATPEVSIRLGELNRKYSNLQQQYKTAQDRLSRARTGDRIESRSRGQRISVIDQPVAPSAPTKPDRVLIAGGGLGVAVLAGLALIFGIELLNRSARRPEDLVRRFGVTPLTTIPYIRTRRQTYRQRGMKLALLLAILVGVPAAIYAIHVYYLPLDLIADRVMNKLGVRL